MKPNMLTTRDDGRLSGQSAVIAIYTEPLPGNFRRVLVVDLGRGVQLRIRRRPAGGPWGVMLVTPAGSRLLPLIE